MYAFVGENPRPSSVCQLFTALSNQNSWFPYVCTMKQYFANAG